MKYFLVFDIGGTFVKWGIFDKNKKLVEKNKFETQISILKTKGLIKKLAEFTNEINLKYKTIISDIGFSIPGVINSKNSTVIGFTPNLNESQNVNFQKEFFKHYKHKVTIVSGNDANFAALGEMYCGSLKGTQNGLLITLGTGIGGGIIINSKIFEGNNYWAGEIGRQIINGKKWETQASTKGLIDRIKNKTGKLLTGEEISKLIAKDKIIAKIYNDWLNEIAIGLANIIFIINPKVISIGGGISANKEFNVLNLQKLVSKIVGPELSKEFKIVKAKLKNDAALFGMISIL